MYSEEKIEEIIQTAIAAKLSGVDLLFDRVLVRRVCNGIGAAWMPDWMRDVINSLIPELVPVSFIHDIRFEIGGPWWKRWAADFEFSCNGIRMAFYSKKRRVAAWSIRLWICLMVGGWTAFNYKKEGDK